MRLYTVEECKKWIERRADYNGMNQLYFTHPNEEKDWNDFKIPLVDMAKKTFTHDEMRIWWNVEKIRQGYEPLDKILNNFSIYICPYPNPGFQNAEVWNGKDIIFYARTTQIPSLMTDYITAHEIGHVVQDKLCSDYPEKQQWREYLRLRKAPYGLIKDAYLGWDEEKHEQIRGEKEDYFCLHGVKEWDERPTEWFAEDFRYFFGTYNSWELSIPEPTEEIKEFMLSL
jgi:hypothetical protein